MKSPQISTSRKDRWEHFAYEYVATGFRPIDAYLAVFPDVDRETASTSATRLFKNPVVQQLIEKEKAKARLDRNFVIDKALDIFHSPKSTPSLQLKTLKFLTEILKAQQIPCSSKLQGIAEEIKTEASASLEKDRKAIMAKIQQLKEEQENPKDMGNVISLPSLAEDTETEGSSNGTL